MQGSTRIDELRQKFHENPRRYFAPLANEYRKAGDPEQAIAICRAHLAQQPGHMSGHVVYGQALYDAKRIEEARVVFEKALSLDPDNAIVLRHLGDIARQKGETSEARHWYSRALDADPQDSEVAAYIAELTEPDTETTPYAGAAEPVDETPVAEPVDEMPAAEPVVVAEPVVTEEVVAESADEDVAWRKTPHHEESPFVTKTMAELYEKQGYRDAALDVYRQLALHQPDDLEIQGRIEELEKPEIQPTIESPQLIDLPEEPASAEAAASSEEPMAPDYSGPEEPDVFVELPPREAMTELPSGSPLTGFDAPLISDSPSEPETVSRTEDQPRVDPFFSLENESFSTEVEPDTSEGPKRHFTEMELDGDTWNTDSWAAGFSSEESATLDFEAPDVPAAQPAAEVAQPADEPEPEQIAEPVPIPEAVASQADDSPYLEPEPAFVEPEPVAIEPEPAYPEPEAASPQPEPAQEPEPEPAPEIEQREQELVAYSPQLPEPDELPHFAPRAPTVREFFAALGVRRPPSDEPERSFTARAAVPEIQIPDDYPLAGDAFANMFADSPVNEEDSRAAFALSGALGAATPQPETVVQSPVETPAVVTPPAPAAAQESEEDIRRFREWLDGLAEP
jgi:hypothetical protein